jgi:predicted regulator of Ras-like GTPase activity (Roadblock/LC7/MglB family)
MTITASQDEIVQVLTSLKVNAPGVKSVALTTLEGRNLGSTVAEADPRFKLASLSAAAIAIAKKTSGELSLGGLEQVHVLSSAGSLLLGAVGTKALLSVVTTSSADFGQVSREMKRISAQLMMMV